MSQWIYFCRHEVSLYIDPLHMSWYVMNCKNCPQLLSSREWKEELSAIFGPFGSNILNSILVTIVTIVLVYRYFASFATLGAPMERTCASAVNASARYMHSAPLCALSTCNDIVCLFVCLVISYKYPIEWHTILFVTPPILTYHSSNSTRFISFYRYRCRNRIDRIESNRIKII